MRISFFQRLLAAIAWVLVITTVCGAQEKKANPARNEPPARIEVAADMQQLVTQTNAGVGLATSALEVARLKLENLILKLRLTLKVPDDYEARLDQQGRLYFEKVLPSPSPPQRVDP